jgi:hypothetical protein
MNLSKTAVSGLSLVALLLPVEALAQFPHLPSMGAQPVHQAVTSDASSTGFFSDFTHARVEINAAQYLLAQAFGLKDQVAELEAERTALSSGVLDADGYKKSKQISDSTNAAIADRMEHGAVLSAEGRAEYEAAIPHLLIGTLITVKLAPEATAMAQAARASAESASFTDKMRVAEVAIRAGRVAADLPGFVANTVTAYKRVVTYGTANNLQVPKDATAALGSL